MGKCFTIKPLGRLCAVLEENALFCYLQLSQDGRAGGFGWGGAGVSLGRKGTGRLMGSWAAHAGVIEELVVYCDYKGDLWLGIFI